MATTNRPAQKTTKRSQTEEMPTENGREKVETQSKKGNSDNGQLNAERKAVDRYLKALERPPRKPKRSLEAVERKLNEINDRIEQADALQRLQLEQKALDLQKERDNLRSDHSRTLEDNFVAHAKAYAERFGISYRAWREVGVPANVLRRAGIVHRAAPVAETAEQWADRAQSMVASPEDSEPTDGNLNGSGARAD